MSKNEKFSIKSGSIATPSVHWQNSQDVRAAEQINGEKDPILPPDATDFEEFPLPDNKPENLPQDQPSSFELKQRWYADRFEVPKDNRGNPIYSSYTNPKNPYGPGAPHNPLNTVPPSRIFNITGPPSYQCRPVPKTSPGPARVGDVARTYQQKHSTYSGNSSVRESLSSHRRKYYNTCRLANLNADQGRDALIAMFKPNSIAYFYKK